MTLPIELILIINECSLFVGDSALAISFKHFDPYILFLMKFLENGCNLVTFIVVEKMKRIGSLCLIEFLIVIDISYLSPYELNLKDSTLSIYYLSNQRSTWLYDKKI